MFSTIWATFLESANKVKEIGIKPIILTIILMGGLYLLCVVIVKVETITKHFPTAAQETENFHNTRTANRQITVGLEKTRELIDADRVIVNQFHNGQNDISGVPFMKATMTYVALRQGVAWKEDYSTAAPIQVYADLVDRVWEDTKHPKCIKIKFEEIDNPIYRQRLLDAGTALIFACPMTNLGNVPNGLIIVGYLKDEPESRPTDELVMANVQALSTKIVGYLDDVKTEEKKSWLAW